TPHTYLDGTIPFTYRGWWVVDVLHSTATLSSEDGCDLYGLRVMHCLNIFLSRHGHSGWVGLLFFLVGPSC
ncbi:hypothetical protein DL96DRAFT_1787159, partial [Flagelloscypha sp. PMI_526]